MAILTPLPLEGARRLGALYGLEIAGIRGILAGSVNSNYALELAGGGRVFLRVYEEQGREAATREAGLLEHLCAAGVPTPRPLRRVDAGGGTRERGVPTHVGGTRERGVPTHVEDFVAEHAGKPVAVFPWVDGEALCQARVGPAEARAVGAALARVHVAGASFEEAQASRFGLEALAERLDVARGRPELSRAPELAAAVEALGARLDAVRRDLADAPEAGEVLIHGDLFRDNVLWGAAGIAALLDFESASRGSAAFDLAVTTLAWCFGDDLDPALAGALGEGYAAVRPLSAAERGRLFADASFAALRFSITRITDYELRPAGSGVHKDYRRFLARQRALDRLGPEGLRGVLRV